MYPCYLDLPASSVKHIFKNPDISHNDQELSLFGDKIPTGEVVVPDYQRGFQAKM